MAPRLIAPVFFALFKGMLAFFLLEMGLVAASRIGDLRREGWFLLFFATLTPLACAGLGLLTGIALGLSVGGLTLLATLYASASYIAAPAAIRHGRSRRPIRPCRSAPRWASPSPST